MVKQAIHENGLFRKDEFGAQFAPLDSLDVLAFRHGKIEPRFNDTPGGILQFVRGGPVVRAQQRVQRGRRTSFGHAIETAPAVLEERQIQRGGQGDEDPPRILRTAFEAGLL